MTRSFLNFSYSLSIFVGSLDHVFPHDIFPIPLPSVFEDYQYVLRLRDLHLLGFC